MAADPAWGRLGEQADEVYNNRSHRTRGMGGDHTEFPREVAEAALAHVFGDKAEAAYRRSKRRKPMDDRG